MGSCLFLRSSSVHSFEQYNLSSCDLVSLHIINHFCKSPLNLISELFVFHIMWIPSTNADIILNMRPDRYGSIVFTLSRVFGTKLLTDEQKLTVHRNNKIDIVK